MSAIIDEEKFETVQKLLKERERTKGNLKSKSTYLLSTLLVCDKGGAKFHASSRKGGRNSKLYYSYRCSRRKALKKEKNAIVRN